jgi:type IV pilus assembly protein PilW
MMRGTGKRYAAATLVSGLTLIELLVALVLGVLLSGGIVSAYLGAKRNLFYEDQMARMQENGRYAMRLLSRELMMAGFYGGLPASIRPVPLSVGTDCSDMDWALDSTHALDLVNDYAGQTEPISLHLNVLTCLDHDSIVLDTDLITLKRTAADASLDQGVPPESLSSSAVQKWYLRVVSGSRPEWVKMSSVDLDDPANAQPSLSFWEAISRVIFIRAYANDRGDNIPSLCMETLAGDAMTARCLVEGVEDLQFEFGIDSDNDGVPNQYLASPTAAQLHQAVTVRIHLLLRSIGELTGHHDDTAYRLGQKALTPRNDAYLRRVFSSTVLLRNHTAIGS